MNALLVLDYYVWKIFVVRIRPAWFRLKPFSFLSLLYVSLFPLPRKYLLHYFRGTGRPLQVDTREVILQNPRLLAFLQKRLNEQVNAHHGEPQLESKILVNTSCGPEKPYLPIGQHLVNHPNHRYAIGSLNLNYVLDGDLMHISLASEYRFSGNNDRITKYLHQWLNSIMESRAAAKFKIEGSVWSVSRCALLSSDGFSRNKKYIDYNILYI